MKERIIFGLKHEIEVPQNLVFRVNRQNKMPRNPKIHLFDIFYFLLFSIMPKCRRGREVLITGMDW